MDGEKPANPAVVGMPDAEFEITETLVRNLLAAQHPDFERLPLVPWATGWDNVIFRLGKAMTVRLPRREVANRLMLNEQRWLPEISDGLPISTPTPLRVGIPDSEYPWHWSVLPWFEGEGADQAAPSSGEVEVLADFLVRLHQLAPDDAPQNPVRGVPLSQRFEATQDRISRLQEKTNLVTPALLKIWERGLSGPLAPDSRWLHGDLHAQNVLVANGRFTAVIDWGDITGGDVATDLTAIWGLFENQGDRERVLNLYAPDQATLDRAMAWAVMFGVILVDSGLVNSSRHEAQGRDLLARLLVDA